MFVLSPLASSGTSFSRKKTLIRRRLAPCIEMRKYRYFEARGFG
jgi:hypothetical protein